MSSSSSPRGPDSLRRGPRVARSARRAEARHAGPQPQGRLRPGRRSLAPRSRRATCSVSLALTARCPRQQGDSRSRQVRRGEDPRYGAAVLAHGGSLPRCWSAHWAVRSIGSPASTGPARSEARRGLEASWDQALTLLAISKLLYWTIGSRTRDRLAKRLSILR